MWWREGSRPVGGRTGFKRMPSAVGGPVGASRGRKIHKAACGPELPVRGLLVRTAKLRWRIEHDYLEMKQAHVTVMSVAHAFCTSSASPGLPKRRRQPEPLPSRPLTGVTPRGLDRRLPHLSPHHTRPPINLIKHY